MQPDLGESENREKTITCTTNSTTDGVCKGTKADRSLTVGQLGKSSLLKIDLKLMNFTVKAAVDTAAEVSIISDNLYKKLKKKPPTLRHAVVNTAGRGMQMDTLIVGPVDLQIGSKFYRTELYVAPIEDDMLLGLNFMVTYKVAVDMGQSKFVINGDEFDLNSDKQAVIPVIARVSIPKRTVIPPNTLVHVNGQLDTKMENYVVEQCKEMPILVSRCYYKDQDQPRLCLLNTTDRPFTIKRTQF